MKTLAAQWFLATPAIGDIGLLRAKRFATPMVCRVVDERASRAPACLRQHFLKPDAVFLHVLVYSGCSASRFPSARSNKATHYIRRATWPRKLRRRRSKSASLRLPAA